jgi:electron transfer flavoprotein alpha subunit
MAARITNKCIGCGVCVDVCPYGALELFEGQAIVSGHCTVCGSCAEVCPASAIEIEGAASEGLSAQDKTAWTGVWVFAEREGEGFAPVAYELLAKARTLADELTEPVTAVVLGAGVASSADLLVAAGADKVIVVDHALLEQPLIEPYMRTLVELIVQRKPAILLAGATTLGRSVMPAIAAVLETGLTADCTGLAIDPDTKLLRQTRPTFGGNLMATIVCPERRPQMATVRPHVFQKEEPDSSRKGETEIVQMDDAVFASATKFVEKHTELAEDERLEDADVIVAGGRGMGKPENLTMLNDLAHLFHGAVGASRPLVDEGWLPYVHQVGQTGKTVGPKLYLACGISGAIQHTAGMATSKIVVAINKDPDAPIFDVADFGIIGDINEVLPALIERLKKENG